MKSTPGKLFMLAQARGLSVLDLVKAEVIQTGGSQVAAAGRLGVSPGTIRFHLRRAQLRPVVRQVVDFETIPPHPEVEG